ncbi:hypothetical protein [Cyclobacterium qasimii]|uniref:Uncharacterized protein n=2 Tax=Cyclobacterium qasimii TaxID=1350429 RepID=S7VPA3_9BACT|nr:hypothetical protein [Cyclobacterium qasimii]EPR71766.1 hypothetical protein ADICYQ_0014 [Cyclobacterium qasimii M12-11B]GEO22182.1 hypothetical protein CQA01_27160 [Cyclobacterium qasimii]
MHTVWLVRSQEYALDKFWEVLELLKTFKGPLQFKTQEKPLEIPADRLEEIPFSAIDLETQEFEPLTLYSLNHWNQDLESLIFKKATWNTIFDQCQEYRTEQRIPENDFIVLLTEHNNEYSWFTAADPKGQRNLFVHTAFWDQYTGTDHRYPVAYHVATAILQLMTFANYNDLNMHLHKTSRGCINDFCADKKKISLKLRTADICPSCIELLDKRKVDREVIRQVLAIIEGIREQMLFKSRWKLDPKPLKLQIKGESKQIIFPELGNLEVKLTPLEKTLYLLFINHPEGIRLVELSDFRPELKGIYSSLYNGSEPASIESNTASLSNPLSNSASEKLSRIKSKFNHTLGTDLAKFYYPVGENTQVKKIELERNLIEYIN